MACLDHVDLPDPAAQILRIGGCRLDGGSGRTSTAAPFVGLTAVRPRRVNLAMGAGMLIFRSSTCLSMPLTRAAQSGPLAAKARAKMRHRSIAWRRRSEPRVYL
jgi:hypothetical protein